MHLGGFTTEIFSQILEKDILRKMKEGNQGFRTRITHFLFFPSTESPDESLLHQERHFLLLTP